MIKLLYNCNILTDCSSFYHMLKPTSWSWY